MTEYPHALLINTSPSLQRFNERLCAVLAQSVRLGCWQYEQTADEPLSLAAGVVLLHDYLKHCDRPLDLLAHGTSGWLALLYARRHPERVRSLTLLAVGAHAASDWHAHYYARLQLLPCPRQVVLRQMVKGLFGNCCPHGERELIALLERDLRTALSPHTLYEHQRLPPAPVAMPLLICGSRDDIIAAPNDLNDWQPWLKSGDVQWCCPGGRHFFHHVCPHLVARQIVSFWQAIGSLAAPVTVLPPVSRSLLTISDVIE
ncbi:MAG: alpha/beta hydrolase [Spirulinaceae cyanobacterium SM2_1_0]|nr:alpha/beta hydrolase [Spirulinaceae cyanobacterium SM2_1_0]